MTAKRAVESARGYGARRASAARICQSDEKEIQPMIDRFSKIIVCVGVFSVLSAQALAQPDGKENRAESPFSADISIGAEYDSNISVNEIDSNTGADDFSAVIDADFDFEKEFGDGGEINLGYSFSQSLHEEFTSFDIQSHFLSAGLSHDVGEYNLGAAYRFIYVRLDGDDFLQMQQFSPYASRLFGKKLYLRTDYTYSDKDFNNRTDRDATAHAGGVDVYYFIDGTNMYVATGYKYKDEDATDPQFSFHSHNLKARISRKIPMGKRKAKLKLGWRYETRDYLSITPSIAAIRHDDRHRFQAELEIPVTDRIYALVEYEYSNFSSNLPSADYKQSLAAARLGARF